MAFHPMAIGYLRLRQRVSVNYLTSRLKLEKRPQAVQEGGGVLALLLFVLRLRGRFPEDTFIFHFAPGQQLTQPLETIGGIPQHLGHDRLADLHSVATGSGGPAPRSALPVGNT